MSAMSTCRDIRRSLFECPAIRIEAACTRGAEGVRTPLAFTPTPQFIVPLSGAFIYELGSSQTLVTANDVLLIAAGDESRDRFVDSLPIDYLILTPGESGLDGSRLEPRSRIISSPVGLQRAAMTFWSLCVRHNWVDTSDTLESAVELTAIAMDAAGSAPSIDGSRAHRLVRAVKNLIASGATQLSLAEIAACVKASPTYLTAAFRRHEGMSIGRYQRRLRLGRALLDLPNTEDLAALALDLGFSSHAHFSSAFRAACGESPSQYRQRIRAGKWRPGNKA